MAVVASSQDQLTGLPNRQALLEDFAKSFAGEALAVVKLTNFAWVNVTHGVAVADKVLQEVAGYLSRQAPRSELVYRVGGDEFVVAWLGAGKSDPVNWVGDQLGELRGLLERYETADLRITRRDIDNLRADYGRKQGWPAAEILPDDEPVLLARAGVAYSDPRTKATVADAADAASRLADQARGLSPPLLVTRL